VRETNDTVPARSMPGMGDHPCAMSLFAGIVTALNQREKTGKGTQVMSNLMVNGIWSNGIYAQAALCGAKFQERPPRDHALNAVTCHYKCADGRWIILSLLNEDRQWPTFVKVIGREDLASDPRFETKPIRHKNAAALIAILDDVFAGKPLAEWRTILDGNGLIFGVVGIPTDIPDDPQMRETEAVVPFQDSDLRTINTPIFIEGAKKVQPRMAPNVGQHSDEVLGAAGFTAAEIAKMRAAGIVAG
jgi:crotonobetainyl-CoA:carnitine CoA-transferase CaiB-like acyl-CoA transferase